MTLGAGLSAPQAAPTPAPTPSVAAPAITAAAAAASRPPSLSFSSSPCLLSLTLRLAQRSPLSRLSPALSRSLGSAGSQRHAPGFSEFSPPLLPHPRPPPTLSDGPAPHLSPKQTRLAVRAEKWRGAGAPRPSTDHSHLQDLGGGAGRHQGRLRLRERFSVFLKLSDATFSVSCFEREEERVMENGLLQQGTPERGCGTLHRQDGSTQHERVAPSAPQPPGAGACRRFRSVLAKVGGSGAGRCWSSGTTAHDRVYRANTAKRIRSCCPGSGGKNPTTGKVNCVRTSHPPPSDPPSSPLALALPAIEKMKKSKPGSAQTRPLAPAAARPGVKGLGGGQDRLPQQRLRVLSSGRLALLGLWERTGHSPAASWPNPPRLSPPHPPATPPVAGCPPPQPLGWENSELPQMEGSSRREGPRVRMPNSSPPPPSGWDFTDDDCSEIHPVLMSQVSTPPLPPPSPHFAGRRRSRNIPNWPGQSPGGLGWARTLALGTTSPAPPPPLRLPPEARLARTPGPEYLGFQSASRRGPFLGLQEPQSTVPRDHWLGQWLSKRFTRASQPLWLAAGSPGPPPREQAPGVLSNLASPSPSSRSQQGLC
ncbi:NHS-like protein 3 [Muntiacus reevesi]|uniref:NHS-like protein 3 n=1 Tax=Muntiacus reevesi TaxID=9886 RepID=UPI003307142C